MKKIYKALGAGILSIALATGTSHSYDPNKQREIIVTENSPEIFVSKKDVANLEDKINGTVQELINPANIEKTTEYLSELTRYHDFFTRAHIETGIDMHLLEALVWHESLVDPKAVSPKGAKGLCQFTRPTARYKEIRVDRFKDYRSHPICIEKAAEYLGELYKKLGEDMLLALMSYNAGIGKINDSIKKYGKKSVRDMENIPEETKRFMIGILAKYYIIRNMNHFGVYPEKKKLFSLEEKEALRYVISRGDTVYDISKMFGLEIEEIKKRNPALKDVDMIKPGDELLVPVNY